MSEFTDTVVTHKESRAGDDRVIRGGAPIEDPVELDRHSRGGGILESYSDGKAQRELPDSIKERIAKLEAEDKGAEVEGEPAVEVPEAELVPTREGEAKPAAITAAPAAAAPSPEIDTLKAERDRLLANNAALVAEAEARAGKVEPVTPHKLLSEATNSYLDDTIGAHRRFIAASLGIEDPASKEVDVELAALYADLTAKELGVTPDPNHEAKREAARTRQLLERDKRERKAESEAAVERAKAEAEVKQAEGAAQFVGNRFQTKRDDGRSLADDHPLLNTLSETFDGMKPEKLLVEVLKREIKTGRIVLSGDDSKDIAAAARFIEDHYAGLVDKVVKAKPQPPSNPSTATTPSGTQPPAAKQSASKETRTQPAARTLTTADASVAPATPPAQAAATTEKKPKFKNDKERRDWALRHLK